VANSLFWRYWAPPIFWALVIMALSGDLGSGPKSFSIVNWVLSWFVTLRPDTLSTINFYVRKVLHVVFYGVLAVLWLRALTASHPGRAVTNKILALALCLAVALTDEGHQYVVGSRTASWFDVGLDLSGGVVFLSLALGFTKRK